MNELEVERSLAEIATSATHDHAFLQEFPVRLLNAYQASPSQIARLVSDNATRASRMASADPLGLADCPVDFVWPKRMHYRSATSGHAQNVVDELAAARKPKAIPGKTSPRFVLSTDGSAFAAIDLKTGERFLGETLTDLVDQYDFLQPMFGIERYVPPAEQEADVRAAKHMRGIHDAFVAADSRWSQNDHAEALNTFMIRLLFCLFADGAGVFPPKHGTERPFARIMEWHARQADGSHTQGALRDAFRILDLREEDPVRASFEPRFRDLPYTNGKLFEKDLPIPAFNGRAQRALRDAMGLDWSHINADIFGSMIQAIAGEGDRSHFGMHYTSVPNIMKVIGPLFIDSLKEQLAAAGADRRKLEALINRIAAIHVFDPACGSGNFLIIAYREMRAIETSALATIHGAQRVNHIASKVRLDHFHGVDPVDFACRTARLSLWISQIQADRKLMEIGIEPPAILPLHDAGDIRQGSALDIFWADVVPSDIGETYIVGNPPYLGSTYQSAGQKADMDRVFGGKLRTWRNLDFVAAWFALAAEHVAKTGSQAAFVSTNSICQGEQVPTLWPWISKLGVEIGFAHTSFKWSNLAANKAGVACAIVGLRRKTAGSPKTIHSERVLEDGQKGLVAREVRNISPYLTASDDIIVDKSSRPLNGLPEMIQSNKPTDGGHLLLDRAARSRLLARHPEAERLLKPIMGSQEFVRGEDRWCLWIEDQDLDFAMGMDGVRERVDNVRTMRLASTKANTVKIANRAHSFDEYTATHHVPSLIMPVTTSERRQYLQCSILTGVTISNSAYAVLNAHPWLMALLSTRMMHQWTFTVGSKFKEDPRFSNTMVYNTFPVPTMRDDDRERLNDLGLSLIEVRQPYHDDGHTIAWLYDPKTMPDDLRAVHDEIDAEFEHMYVRRRFKDDAERLEHMFRLYAKTKGKKQ